MDLTPQGEGVCPMEIKIPIHERGSFIHVGGPSPPMVRKKDTPLDYDAGLSDGCNYVLTEAKKISGPKKVRYLINNLHGWKRKEIRLDRELGQARVDRRALETAINDLGLAPSTLREEMKGHNAL